MSRTSSPQQKVVLLVNTKSRRGQRYGHRTRQLLPYYGLRPDKIIEVKHPKRLQSYITNALKQQPTLLIAGGGDGTISQVANRLAYKDITLGILPLGTTNNFARSLGLPLTLDSAIEVIANGKTSAIDLAQAGEHYFANVASLGVSVKIATSVPSGLKRRAGRLAYVLTSAKTLLNHHAFYATLTDQDSTSRFRTHQLIVANGSTHSGLPIATDAHIDDKLLTVFKIGGVSRWHLIWDGLQIAAMSRYRKLSHGAYINTGKVTIDTEPKQQVEIDGEVIASTPITIAIAPDALKIKVPHEFADS